MEQPLPWRHTTVAQRPTVIEALLAVVVLAACSVMLVRLALGYRRRQRFDAAMQRAALAIRLVALRCWHWRSSRKHAARAADDAIKRARGGHWDGNVYKPKSFRRPRKPH